MANNIIKYSLIGGLAYLLFRSTKQIKTTVQNNIAIGDISVSAFDASFLSLDLKLDIQFINNNPVPLPFDKFRGFLFFGNNNIANVEIPTSHTVPANGSIVLPVSISASTVDLGQDLISIITSGDLSGKLRVDGSIISSNISIPVSKIIRII